MRKGEPETEGKDVNLGQKKMRTVLGMAATANREGRNATLQSLYIILFVE